MCASEPRSFASTSASIWRGESSRSTNQMEEHVAKASSSVTLKLVRASQLGQHGRAVSLV